MIEKMRAEHIVEIAKIHASSWGSYELSVKLGQEYVKRCLYASIVACPAASAYVSIENGKIAGYCTGIYRLQEFNRYVVRKHTVFLAGAFLKGLLNGRVKVADVYDLLRDNKKLKKLQFPEHHLGALALSNEYKKTPRGREIIVTLIETVMEDLRNHGCGGIFGAVYDENIAMQKLLLNLGFEQVDTVRYFSKTVLVFEKAFSGH